MSKSKYFFKKKIGEKDVIKRITYFLCHACDKYLGTEGKLKSENIKSVKTVKPKYAWIPSTKTVILLPYQSKYNEKLA